LPGKGQWLGALEVQRASIRGTAVQLSRTQFPDLYASVDDFAATLGVKPAPAVYLSNGNGTLNAFAAQSGWTSNYVVAETPRARVGPEDAFCGAVCAERLGRIFRCPCGCEAESLASSSALFLPCASNR